jgi:hypothetical protein
MPVMAGIPRKLDAKTGVITFTGFDFSLAFVSIEEEACPDGRYEGSPHGLSKTDAVDGS